MLNKVAATTHLFAVHCQFPLSERVSKAQKGLDRHPLGLWDLDWESKLVGKLQLDNASLQTDHCRLRSVVGAQFGKDVCLLISAGRSERIIEAYRQQEPRGQIVPYADQRAYTDRLNALFTPGGWTRKYAIHTSANFERSKDQKIVAKVLVTCELTIFGLGLHSATGEVWADDDNAGTAAEAQAFKRACACFGLGRYLYYFTGTWVDLDDKKRPKSVPQLAGWATPAGWRKGLRPRCAHEPGGNEGAAAGKGGDIRQNGQGADASDGVLPEIEGFERVVGKRMYRGLLKSVARVWNPRDIQDQTIRKKVLAHMQAAERGLRRAQAARVKAGSASCAAILASLKLRSLEQVDNLKTLQEIVDTLEAAPIGKGEAGSATS